MILKGLNNKYRLFNNRTLKKKVLMVSTGQCSKNLNGEKIKFGRVVDKNLVDGLSANLSQIC